jgi:opacity protein-like surface antigen
MSKAWFLIWIFAILPQFPSAQATPPAFPKPSLETREADEVELKAKDILSFGLSLGFVFSHQNTVQFQDTYFGSPAHVQEASSLEDTNFEGGLSVRLSCRYGLDHYLIPGLSLGLDLEYYYTNIELNTLKVTQPGSGAVLLDYKGGFASVNSLGIVPVLEARLLSLSDYLLDTDLPTSWEIYLYAGPRINYNHYTTSDLKMEGADDLVVTWEIGLGWELFFSKEWALRVEYSLYKNETDFTISSGSRTALKGNLDLEGSRVLVGMMWYW